MPKEPTKNPLEEGKKTSVLLTPDLVQKLNTSPLNQSQTILEALRFFFSEDKERIEEYQHRISEYEKRELEYTHTISLMEARLEDKDFLKREVDKLHDLIERQRIEYIGQLDKQREDYRINSLQIQDLLNKRETELRQKDALIFSKEEKILLLEGEEDKRKKEEELKVQREDSKKKRRWWGLIYK